MTNWHPLSLVVKVLVVACCHQMRLLKSESLSGSTTISHTIDQEKDINAAWYAVFRKTSLGKFNLVFHFGHA